MGDSDGTKCRSAGDVRPREVVNAAVGICADSSLLRHVGVMTSETLARAGTQGRLVVLEARVGPKGWGVTGVSMMLTSTPLRRRTPKKNRRIPTIPAGNIDVGPVNVSAVDTGPRRSESGLLTARSGAPVTGPPAPLPDRRLRRGLEAMTRRLSRLESACSTRVGIH